MNRLPEIQLGFPLRRSACALTVSVLLHATILVALGWLLALQQSTQPSPMLVTLRPSLHQATASSPPVRPMPGLEKTLDESPRRTLPKLVEADTTSLSAVDALPASNMANQGKTLNLEGLRNEARGYAQTDHLDTGANSIAMRDYYGRYNGDDQGTFHFHLDHGGRLSGTAESSWRSQSFPIHGEVGFAGNDSNEPVPMVAIGLAGAAHFKGRIDPKTGHVSGHWSVASLGGGQFSGQRE